MLSPGARSVAGTFVTLALAYGVWYSYSVFLVALLAEFGWSRSLVAGAFSLFSLVHGFAGAPLGWLADRVGPRRLGLAGGLVVAAGLLLDGAVSRPWHLYVTFGVVTAAGVSAAGWVPAIVLVQRWFPARMGTALGFASAGIGAGIFVFGPASQWLIDLVGWRWAFRAVGLAMLAWIVPATLWLVRDPPPAPRPAAATAAGADVTLAAAAHTPTFWLLAVTQFSGAFTTQMLLVHQVAYLVDHGIPALVGASVVGVVGLASIAGKVGGGWTSDRVGREATYTLGAAAMAASVGSLGLLALAPRPAWAWTYGVLVGLGYGISAPLTPAVANDFFRGRHFGAIFGALHMSNAVGASLGPWLGGRVFDATGSYQMAFTAAAAATAVGTATLWIAAPRRRYKPGT